MKRRDDFDAFYRDYYKRLVRLAARAFRDLDAEEIAQETMARAWTKFDELRPGCDPWPWLTTIARRVAINAYRQRKRTVSVDGALICDLSGDVAPPADLAVLEQEVRRNLERALEMLDAEQRFLLRLRHIEQRTCIEIAEFLGITPNYARQKLLRARKALRIAYLRVAGPVVALLPGALTALRRLLRKLAPAGAVPVAALTAATTIMAVVVGGVLGTTGGGRSTPERSIVGPSKLGHVQYVVRDTDRGSRRATDATTSAATTRRRTRNQSVDLESPAGTRVKSNLRDDVQCPGHVWDHEITQPVPILGRVGTAGSTDIKDREQRSHCDKPLLPPSIS